LELGLGGQIGSPRQVFRHKKVVCYMIKLYAIVNFKLSPGICLETIMNFNDIAMENQSMDGQLMAMDGNGWQGMAMERQDGPRWKKG
jgi:hypothetical protein